MGSGRLLQRALSASSTAQPTQTRMMNLRPSTLMRSIKTAVSTSHRLWLMSGLLVFGVLTTFLSLNPRPIAASFAATPPASQSELFLLRVHIDTPDQTAQLIASGLDVLEARGPDYLLMIGDAAVERQLLAQGFRVERQRTLTSVEQAHWPQHLFRRLPHRGRARGAYGLHWPRHDPIWWP